jgi:hypothetical protein
VTVVFVTLENTKIELIEPLGENSPIAKFLQKNPMGGIHHVCVEVCGAKLQFYFIFFVLLFVAQIVSDHYVR